MIWPMIDIANGLACRVLRMLARSAAAGLARRGEGSATVEFGLVAVPFIALLFAIVETAIVFFAGQTLETAAAEAARLILTGQAQSQAFDATKFKNAVCAKIFAIFDCQNGIYVDVRTFSSFSSVSMPNPVDGQGNFQSSSFTYQPGGPGDIVVARLFYQYPVYVSLLGFNLANVSGGKRLLTATAAFRNEPYGN
jgi:Flp pilus assembly protein TadG